MWYTMRYIVKLYNLQGISNAALHVRPEVRRGEQSDAHFSSSLAGVKIYFLL